MRVLFVTPSEISSGEAVTTLHMARDVASNGGSCAFIASPFTADLLEPEFRDRVERLGTGVVSNGQTWSRTVASFRPDIVVFADYPLLRFASGCAPLPDDDTLFAPASGTAFATLDHHGYARSPGRIFFGPTHLSMQSEAPTPVPDGMRLLLPCPMNETRQAERPGQPFRFLPPPGTTDDEALAAARLRFAGRDGGQLVVHVGSSWAARFARRWSLPHHRLLPDVFVDWFSGVGEPVVVVSIDHDGTTPDRVSENVSVIGPGTLPPADFAALIAAADLLITDNAVSATAGRRICQCAPIARLHNPRRLLEIVETADERGRHLAMRFERARPGAVFPFEVFPIWDAATLDQLGLLADSRISAAMRAIDLFGGNTSATMACSLLTDASARESLREVQQSYAADVRSLPGPFEVLRSVLDQERAA